MKEYDSLKKNLENFVLKTKENEIYDRKTAFNKFSGLGAPRRTLDRWLDCLEINETLDRKPGTGRPTKIATRGNITILKKYFNHRAGRSQRKAAKRLNTTQSYVSRMLKKHSDIRCRKKIKKPL